MNNRDLNKKQKGFTLIELVVTVAIASILVIVVLSLFQSVNKSSQNQLNDYLNRDEVRQVVARMTEDIRYSQDVDLISEEELKITNKSGNIITYSIMNVGSNTYLTRTDELGNSAKIQEIEDVFFTVENDNLVDVRFVTDVENNVYKDVKIARWNDEIDITKPSTPFEEGQNIENMLLYTKKINFLGNDIYARNGSVFIDNKLARGDFNGGSNYYVKDFYINGDAEFNAGVTIGLKNEDSHLYVNGNLNLKNSGESVVYSNIQVSQNFILKDAIIYGDVYVGGNVELYWTPKVYGNIYYKGKLSYPNNYPNELLSKCIKVDSVESLDMKFEMPTLKEESWFTSKGYNNASTPLADGAKIYAEGNYSYAMGNGDVSNVILVCTGNVNITSKWRTFSGLIYAPYGSVSFGGSTFTGVVISRDGFTFKNGGSQLIIKRLEELIPDKSNYPFIIN